MVESWNWGSIYWYGEMFITGGEKWNSKRNFIHTQKGIVTKEYVNFGVYKELTDIWGNLHKKMKRELRFTFAFR